MIAYRRAKSSKSSASDMLTDMAETESKMLALGTEAPGFTLSDPDGRQHSLDNSGSDDAYLVMFICNHCPYVKHVAAELASIGNDYGSRKVAIYAINSNDAQSHPGDNPEAMKQEIANAIIRASAGQ